jgi:hypothetical protein
MTQAGHEQKGGAASRKALVLEELLAHLPFSIFFTAAGILVAGLLLYFAIVACPPPGEEGGHAGHGEPAAAEARAEEHAGHEPGHAGCDHGHDHAAHAHEAVPVNPHMRVASAMVFHLFHPIHLLFSAIATSAMFWRHDRSLWKSILIGAVGAIGVCGLSDIFLPYVAGQFLHVDDMHFHWCLLEHPQMVLPFVAIGIACGILASGRIGRSTEFSHSSHIFVSVVATLFYLIAFGLDNWVAADVFPAVFVVVILCVTIPCCFSDIVFPLLSVSCPGTACCAHEHEH